MNFDGHVNEVCSNGLVLEEGLTHGQAQCSSVGKWSRDFPSCEGKDSHQ